MKVLIKAMRPHRQKVLTEDGEEMRLQQWANKAASSALRGAGEVASGEQFTQARDALMREAVANPDEHGLKFMGERVPFEGQTLEESLSEPDVEGERAIIDNQFNQDPMNDPDFKEDMTEDESFELAEKLDRKMPNIFDGQGKLRQTLPQGGKMNENDMHDEALADWEARQSDIDFSREQGHTEGFEGKPYHDMEQEELDADKKRFYGMYPHLKPQEEGGFDPDAEAEHLRRIMNSRDVAMRDALSLLKNLQFPADAGNRREFQRMPGEKHGPNDKFFRYGENPYVPKGHGEKPMRAERPHPYSQLGANVMEDYQLMQEEPEDNQLLTPDELAFAQSIAENDGQMPPAARMPAPTLRQGMNQYNPPIKTSRQVPMRDAWSVLKNDFFNPPEVPCAKCGRPTEPMMYYGSNQMGPQHNTLCEKCEDIPMMEDQ